MHLPMRCGLEGAALVRHEDFGVFQQNECTVYITKQLPAMLMLCMADTAEHTTRCELVATDMHPTPIPKC